MERLRDILSSSRFRGATLGLYVLFLTAVVAVYIGISLLEVQTAAYVRGNAVLEKGEPNPVRGGILEAPTGLFRHDVKVDFFLRPPTEPRGADDEKSAAGERIPLSTAVPRRMGVFHEALIVPDSIEPGTYDLVLEARGPSFERFEASSRVEVVESGAAEPDWPSRTSRISNEERREELESGPIEDQSGEIAIDVLPFDGELPRGLPGRIYLRTYEADSGKPVSATVHFDEVEAMGRWGRGSELPSTVTTDGLGLAELQLEPVGGQKWDVRAEERLRSDSEREEPRSGTATLLIHTVASQLSIELKRSIVRGERLVQGEIVNLFRDGVLYVDLYANDRWLHGTDVPVGDRSGAFETMLPEGAEGESWLYRLQAYRGLYGAGDSWDSTYLVDSSVLGESGRRSILERVAGFVAEHRDEDPYFEHVAESEAVASASSEGTATLEVGLRAYLAAIPRSFSRTETLFNTRAADREAYENWKDEIHSDLMIVIVVGLMGGLGVLAYVVLAGVRRHREHADRLRDVDDDLAADRDAEAYDALSGESPEPEVEGVVSEKIQYVTLAVVALSTFVMFALGLMLLLSYL